MSEQHGHFDGSKLVPGVLPLGAHITDSQVNKPAHYQASDGSGLQVIDVIEAFDLDFRLRYSVQYILRCGRKGNAEDAIKDLKKAVWYVARYLKKEHNLVLTADAQGYVETREWVK